MKHTKPKKWVWHHSSPAIIGVILSCVISNPVLSATSIVALAPGAVNDTTADGVLGQRDFVHNTKNFIDGFGLNMSDQVGDIAIDRSVSPNRVYATDRPNHRVLGWNNISAFATHATANIVIGQPDFSSNICNINNAPPTASSLCNPTGVAVDSLGNLYIADASNNRVLFYKTPFTSDKAADDVIGQYGSLTTNLCNGFGLNENALCTPVRVALDTSNNLYVSDQANNRVLEYNTPQSVTAVAGSGDFTADRVFGQLSGFGVGTANNGGISANSLFTPIGITLDSTGNLFVADFNNHRALKYNTPLTVTATVGSGDTTADKVYGQSNAFNTGIANKTGINGQSMNNPMSIAVAPDGSVYISERSNHRVVGYPATGVTTGNKVLGQFGSLNTNICNNTNLGTVTTPTSSKALCFPDGVALDTSVSPNSPNLYVSDTINNRLLQFKPSATSATNPTLIIKSGQAAQAVIGQSLMSTNFANALDARGFNFADGGNIGNVAIDKSIVPNRIYVSDYANNRVLAWNDIAAFTTHAPATLVFGQPNAFVNLPNNSGTIPATITASTLNGPRGLAVDSLGNLYIADQNNHRILQYNTPFTSGTVADRVFGQAGFITGGCNSSGLNATSLCTPTGLAIDSTNSLYVADWSNNRVLKYNTPLTTNTTADKVYGQSNSLITNTCNLGGITANSLCNPHGVAIDSADNVYIADYSNSRVLEFNKLPATDTTADKVFGQNDVFITNTCNPGGVTATTLCRPRFLAVNSLGHVFVADNDNTRVLKYNSPLTTNRIPDRVFGQGNVFTTNGCKISGTNVSANNLCGIDGIALDPSNNLYIVDGNNNRVLRYLAP